MKKTKTPMIERLRASRVSWALSAVYKPAQSPIQPVFELLTLEPEFDEKSHSLYSDLLIHELEKTGEAAPKSLALTGPYGSGKSSVIDHVKKRFGSRAIAISLPTLGDGVIEEKRETAVSNTSNRISKTNIVQKEIVKQLLYIEKPSKMRGSRFQRIAPVRWGVAIAASAAISISATIVLYATGALVSVVKLLPDNWISAWSVYVGALVSIGVLALIVQSALHSRVTLEEVGSGSAAIKLTSANTNYFDEYLDEIVYFFERTAVDIVIFEDLDRFNEPHIFETLKELNTLLNGSKQLHRRKTIRFVYAIRDSIFDLHRVPGATDVGDGSERAKFFGAIVPLVPFITHRSSAALLLEVLGETAPKNSLLIETVAAHLTDMRLIKNIRNEWEVFRRRILSETGLKGLDPDKMFAMVVYKNLHPADFEKIRSASSLLDVAFRSATELVRQNSAQLADRASTLSDRAGSLSADAQAAELGEALRAVLNQMSSRFGNQAPTEFQLAGNSYTPSEIGSVKFWQELASTGASVSAKYLTVRNYNQQLASADFTREEIANLLHRSIDPAEWERTSREKLHKEIGRLQDERANLEAMSLADLLRSNPNYLVRVPEEDRPLAAESFAVGAEPIAFGTLIAGLFDPAVLDLVRLEMIDLNFTLYSSEFKDTRISAAAMTYFIRFVQTGDSNLVYTFNDVEDIKRLVSYAGVPALEGRSLYNVQIVDYLLTGNPSGTPTADAKHLIGTLAAGTPLDREFIREFVDRSANADALLRELAAHDRGLFAWIVAVYGDDSRMPELLSAALSGATNLPYATDTKVQDLVRTDSPKIPALVQSATADVAATMAVALERLGVEFVDLTVLGSTQRDAIVEKQLFAITEPNLRIAAPGSDLSLDELRKNDSKLADHVLANLGQYLEVVSASNGSIVSIGKSDEFLEVLTWVNGQDSAQVERVAKLASKSCVVSNIAAVDEALWGALSRVARINATLTNLKTLTEGVARGLLEANDILQLLAHSPTIELNATDVVFATELRSLILRASGIAAERKVNLISSLGTLDSLAITDVEADDSDLVARLVEVGLLPDTAETFGHVRGHPVARAAFIARSPSFVSYLEDVQLDLSDLESVANDKSIADKIRDSVLMTNGTLDRGNKIIAEALLKFAHTNGKSVQSRLLAKAIEMGVARDQVLELVPINIANRKAEGLNALLTALGGEYAKLATPGFGSAKLPDDAIHRALVKQLQKVGFAGKIGAKPVSNQTMIVNRRRGSNPIA